MNRYLKLINGTFKHSINEKKIIHFAYEGMQNLEKSTAIIISLTSSVANREKKDPPFFSLQTFSKKTNTPLISISDPLVDKHLNLSLAWYIGDSTFNNLDEYLLEIFLDIHLHTNKRILLTGISGGGYAVLNLIKKANQRNYNFFDFLVINPSTNIKYSLGLEKYLKICNINSNFKIDNYKISLNDISTNQNGLYIQNSNDRYFIKNHFNHFYTNKINTPINFIKYNGKNGHKPLIAKEYYFLLQNFYNLKIINDKKTHLESYLYHFDEFFNDLEKNIIIKFIDGKLSIKLKNENNFNLKYAIYINTKDTKIKFSYKDSLDILQEIKNLNIINNIRLFIKDNNKNIKSTYLNFKKFIDIQD